MEIVAHYYNHNASMHNQKNEGVMVIKQIENHGWFYPGISSIVLERTYSEKIAEKPMITEESIGPWFHTGNAKYNLSSSELINKIIDAVSKNNNFLLNVPPKGDGSFDEAAKTILNEIGQWFAVNGEAIYGSRPWKTFGEGKVRFTTKGNILNIFVDQWPKNELLLASMKEWKRGDVRKVKLLGSALKIKYEQTKEGLKIYLPGQIEKKAACVFQVSCNNLGSLPYSSVDPESVNTINKDNLKKFGKTGNVVN